MSGYRHTILGKGGNNNTQGGLGGPDNAIERRKNTRQLWGFGSLWGGVRSLVTLGESERERERDT